MNVAIRATFWVATFGALGWGLFKVVKPDDELVKQLDDTTRYTSTRQKARDSISVLKEATDQNSELNKKIEELLKRGK